MDYLPEKVQELIEELDEAAEMRIWIKSKSLLRCF
jgi:hypothetical protein